MQRIAYVAVLGALVVVMGACISPNVTVTPVGAERTYPPTADSVVVPIYSVAMPECPFDEIAVISAEGHSSDETLAALRKQARAVGGQAILGYSQVDRGSGSVRAGTAIHFRSSDCTK